MTNKVLDGIRVTDMTLGVAGSSATKLLAELGAEVIKIESPAGEFTRNLIPFVFQTFNRGKRSVAVDIKSDDGVALVKRIAASSDVFIQSQKPGLVAGMGLGREELTSLNPRLIYATFSGYGSTRPREPTSCCRRVGSVRVRNGHGARRSPRESELHRYGLGPVAGCGRPGRTPAEGDDR